MGAPSNAELDAMRLAAGEEPLEDGETSSSVPCCAACGRPLDDVSKMTDEQVLKELRTEMYRDLLRNMRAGMATHQEKAIARGILRDNDIKAEKDDPADDDEESGGLRGRRRRGKSPYADETYDFSPKDLDETAGG